MTREGQLIFFFQFLHAGGRWKEFLSKYPLTYTGNRGSGAAIPFLSGQTEVNPVPRNDIQKTTAFSRTPDTA